ncbi:MAG: MBL fold metallo-hydrolase [Candidatus Bathyarchaeia archaeon]
MGKEMKIISISVGYLLTNCYIIACERTKEALVIDPGLSANEAERLFREIMKYSLQVKYIVNTHGHMDHISGNALVKERTGATIMIHEYDADMLINPMENLSGIMGLSVISPPPDLTLKDEDKIRVGNLEIDVLHTPGHTPGSISLYCRSEGVVFTGDTLFAGAVGRTDFPGSSHRMLIESIREKLLILPDETIAYPGHGEATTIGRERRWNPFLK